MSSAFTSWLTGAFDFNCWSSCAIIEENNPATGEVAIELWASGIAMWFLLERFSIECRKTKIKVITLANHNRPNSAINQSEFKANTCNQRQARENACNQVTIGFGFDLVFHFIMLPHDTNFTFYFYQDVESYDPILNPVLNRELRRTGGRVLITIGDQDIDLSPSFTIFLSTRDPTVNSSYFWVTHLRPKKPINYKVGKFLSNFHLTF